MRATCELEFPEPKVLRDVIVGYDAASRVTDAHVRLVIGDRYCGSGWYWREGDFLELDAGLANSGRVHERKPFDASVHDLLAHPVIGDGFYTRHVSPHSGPRRQKLTFLAVSADHRGATPPALSAVEVTVAYLGNESVDVAAGRFDCHHYQYLADDVERRPATSPPIDVWVTADDDYVYVKGAIGGNFQSEYELMSYERVPSTS
jgi:hypothetical protein